MNKSFSLALLFLLLTSKIYAEANEFAFSVPRTPKAIDVEVGDREAMVFQFRIRRMGNSISLIREPIELKALHFNIPNSSRFRLTHFRVIKKDGSELGRSNSSSINIKNLRINPNESIDLVVIAEVFSNDPEHACGSRTQLSLPSQNIIVLDQFKNRLFFRRQTLRGPRINIIC